MSFLEYPLREVPLYNTYNKHKGFHIKQNMRYTTQQLLRYFVAAILQTSSSRYFGLTQIIKSGPSRPNFNPDM